MKNEFLTCSRCIFLSSLSCRPDKNECESEPCGSGRVRCVNVEGSYKCVCSPGYKHMVNHGRLRCTGEWGWANSMLCFCLDGDQMVHWLCPLCSADVNECSKQDICGVGGQCINLPGSYKCQCHSGFRSKSHRHPVCEGANRLIAAILSDLLCVCYSDVLAAVLCVRVCQY